MVTKTSRDRRAPVWPLAVFVVVAALAAGAVTWWRVAGPQPPPSFGTVPEFSLTERSGRPVTRADLLGRVSVVNFFYTRCADTCPLQSAHLARLQAELGGAPDVQLISVSVDPEHDTPAVLAAYAVQFQADPRRWLFLTGPRDAVYHLAVDGFHLATLAAHGAGPSLVAWHVPSPAWAHHEPAAPEMARLVHASRFALVDRHARIRGYFDGADWGAVRLLHDRLVQTLRER